MPEVPEGYHVVPEVDRKNAQKFFDRAATVAAAGQSEYAIELYLQGLSKDPDAVDAHQALRDVALRHRASGGKKLSMIERTKLSRGRDDKQAMLNAEKLMSYDPGNTDHMLAVMKASQKGGFYDTAKWVGPILMRAIDDGGESDPSKLLTMRDIYVKLKMFKSAVDACARAARLRPGDAQLQTDLRNLSAQETMQAGRYDEGGSFRDSIRDREGQEKLLQQDTGVRTEDFMRRKIAEAEEAWREDPDEPGKLLKLVEALIETREPDNENRAIEILTRQYEKTRSFRFRRAVGEIRLKQFARQEKMLRGEVAKDPSDEQAKQDYRDFQQHRAEQELIEFQLMAENYPTEPQYKYQIAQRLFLLKRYDEAIPMFQQARQDPKLRAAASAMLGRSFLEAEFVDEAIDTLAAAIEEHDIDGDDRAKELYYVYGAALQQRGDTADAIKAYSKVAQWDFNFRDVQQRIRKLRAAAKEADATAAND